MQTNLPGPGPVRPTERGGGGGIGTHVWIILYMHKRHEARKTLLTLTLKPDLES